MSTRPRITSNTRRGRATGAQTVWRLVLPLVLSVCCACQKPFDAKLKAGDDAARSQRWEEARSWWAQASQLDPQSSHAQAKLGVAEWELGHKVEAAQAWAGALATDARSSYALEGLARVDLDSGDAGAALQRLALVAEHTGLAFELLLAQGLLARGEPGDAEGALEAAQRALSSAPADGHGLYLKGCAQIALRKFSEAQETMEALGRQRPENPLGSYGLARLAAAQHRAVDALLHLRAARAASGPAWDGAKVASDPAFEFLVGQSEFMALVSP